MVIAPSKVSSERAQTNGRELVHHFCMAAKTVMMFDVGNVIVKEVVDGFLAILFRCLSEERNVHLQVASDCIFVNENRLRIDFEGFSAFKYTVEALKARDIGTIVFDRDVEPECVSRFLEIFIRNDARTVEPRLRIQEELRAAGIRTIHVDESRELPEEIRNSTESEDRRQVSINTYFKSIFVVKQFFSNLRGGRTGYLRKATRLVHSLVDLVAEDDTTLLALTQIKNFDDFLFTHSANVCVLSLALGQQLGLDKKMLANLGLAALLHDVGMTEVPKDLLARRDGLTDEERELYERHPVLGARTILRSQGISEASSRCLLVALEHHVHEDRSGFPSLGRGRPPSLLAQIVAIADFYDTVTTPDAVGVCPLPPEEALRLMSTGGEEIFEPSLVKLFVNAVGTWPLGAVVRLDNGEMGIVHRKPPHFSPQQRPVVKVVMDAGGNRITPRILDLNETDPATGAYRVEIVETVNPTSSFEDLMDFTELL